LEPSVSYPLNLALRLLTYPARNPRSRSQRLLHHMPHLTCSVDHNAKYRHHQLRPTPRHRLQHANVPGRKLCLIQRHLPALPSRHPRLLANIRNHSKKFVHLSTIFSIMCASQFANCSIALPLPQRDSRKFAANIDYRAPQVFRECFLPLENWRTILREEKFVLEGDISGFVARRSPLLSLLVTLST